MLPQRVEQAGPARAKVGLGPLSKPDTLLGDQDPEVLAAGELRTEGEAQGSDQGTEDEGAPWFQASLSLPTQCPHSGFVEILAQEEESKI